MASLFAHLRDSWIPIVAELKPHGPVLQYVVHTERDPVEFAVDEEAIARLFQIGAEIDCDLYWVAKQRSENGRCVNCGVAIPASQASIRHYIGGEQRAAEIQIKFRLHGIDISEANRVFDLDPKEQSRRLEDNLEVCYLNDLECLQFSSDFLPASGYIDALEPENWASGFAAALIPFVASLPGRREFVVNFTERGDYQGTAGLHFDSKFLALLQALKASLGIRLRYVPEPYFRTTGECLHCDVNVLAHRD